MKSSGMGQKGWTALAATLMAGVGLTRWLWPQLEPARSLPLLPPWPWQQPATSEPAAAPLQLLSKGWQARNLGKPAALG